MDADDVLLQKCKALVEAKLGWDPSTSWTNHDFHSLSARIQEDTGVNLSVATLKRIWGKIRYDSKPTVTTLNTLAQFIGYEHWRAFRQRVHASEPLSGKPSVMEMKKPAAEPALPRKRNRAWRVGLAGIAVSLGVLIVFMNSGNKSNSRVIDPARFSFSSKKVVSEGVPNSVIFDYDATASPTDSVFIQQSWDEHLRKQVSKNDHQHTSIYYTPGFFQAKLVIGKTVVKEHNLLINSNGWMALVKQDPVPVYFKDDEFRKPGMLSVPIGKLKEKNIPLQPESPWTSYYNVRDFGGLRTDNFVFETAVRSDYSDGSAVCRQVQILLLMEGNVIILPLSIPGCVSDLSLAFGDRYVDGKKADLSAFGRDLSQWVKMRCEVRDKKGKIFINDAPAFEADFPMSQKIVGMILRFQGTGSVDYVSLSNGNGKSFFKDDF